MQNSAICTRITSLCKSQTLPIVLCMQNSVSSVRVSNLYGSQSSSVVFGCKTGTFGPEQQVSMGPRYHLSFCACKTASLVQEKLVTKGPSPHLWFLHAKQQNLDHNYMSLWVPDLTYFASENHRWGLGPLETSFSCDNHAVFRSQNDSDFWTRITSLYGSQPSSVVFGCKTAPFGPE